MLTLNEALDQFGPAKINTVTKYPSILTYHALGDKGMLRSELCEGAAFPDDAAVFVTEKVDGTNSRILLWGDDYLIGSREQLLYARGDRFGDPAQNIVGTVRDYADTAVSKLADANRLILLFGETYGGTVTAGSKQYTADKRYHFRLFDVAVVPVETVEELLNGSLDQLSSWRDRGGQPFVDVEDLRGYATQLGADTVPYLTQLTGAELPRDLSGTYQWLQEYALTQAGINRQGRAEGVVLRTADRTLIRKVRFEDYERTKKRGGF